MKHLPYLLLAFLALSSCDYRKSFSTDATTGISTTGNGLSSESVYLEIEGTKVSRNAFSNNEKVFVKFNNMEGFVRKNGRAHVGLAIKITNIITNQVEIENADLFSDRPSGFKESPLLVEANFMAGFPYKDNQKYRVDIRIWDKDGTGEFTLTMPFTVHENELVDVKTTQIDYAALYLWNQSNKVVVADNKIDIKDELLIIFDGLTGFTEQDGRVYPAITLELIDDAGYVLISKENLLSDIEDSGVDPKELCEELPLTVTFGSKLISPAHLKVIITDQISKEQLILKTDLEVTQ